MRSQGPLSTVHVETDEQIRARCVFISQLQQHIEKCEREENYVEADKCKKRYDELCLQDKRARIIRLKERHRLECEQLEQIINEELAEREEAWSQKLTQFEMKYTTDMKTAEMSKKSEFHERQSMIMSKLDARYPRPSAKLAELRKAQNQLVRLGDYKKAEEFKIRADALEQLEIQRKDKENQDSLLKQLETFRKRQETEVKTLRQKFGSQRQQLDEARRLDFERILKKQENIRRSLIQAQTQELQRMKKAPLGMPFMVDEDGNDLLSTGNGLQEISAIMREQKPKLEVKSLVRAYMDGVLTVKPGDCYYSPNDNFVNEQILLNQGSEAGMEADADFDTSEPAVGRNEDNSQQEPLEQAEGAPGEQQHSPEPGDYEAVVGGIHAE